MTNTTSQPTDAHRIKVIEFTDPLCSIAWGTEPKRRLLEWRFGDRLDWRVVMSGLVGDLSKSDGWERSGDKYAFGAFYNKIWRNVTKMTGMPYPVDLKYMAMTTDIACQAVKAAEVQGHDVAERVLRRLREEVFLYGTPVDEIAHLTPALVDVEGLDIDKLMSDYDSEAVKAAYKSDWEETRTPNDYVKTLTARGIDRMKGATLVSEGRERYVLPTFIFQGPCGEVTVPAWREYEELEAAIEQVLPGFIGVDDRTFPTTEQAFGSWKTMTAKELEFVCNAATVAPGVAEEFDWGEGGVWLTEEEASYWRSRKHP